MRHEIGLRELKEIQLEILDEVHSYCRNHGIRYFLSSGTLIGAIRHKGYIPWDDDIDIYMPRKEYELFEAGFNSHSKLFRVVSLATTPTCSFAYAKVERLGTRIIENVDNPMDIGINIDIFPVDSVPDDENERKKYFNRIQRIRDKMILKDVSIDFKRRGLIKNLILLFGKFFLAGTSLRSLAEELDKDIDKTDSESLYVCNLVMGNGLNSVFLRESMAETIQVCFEGKLFDTMKGYDDYLTRTYGDYMQLPPENERETHHSFIAYLE